MLLHNVDALPVLLRKTLTQENKMIYIINDYTQIMT